MALDKYNQRTMMRHLYNGAGMLQRIRLLKRNPDQQQGTVTAYILFYCRRSAITRAGQTLDGKLSSESTTTWHIPQEQLDRFGIEYLTDLDRIVDIEYNTGTWQPESKNKVVEKLIHTHIDVFCRGVNP